MLHCYVVLPSSFQVLQVAPYVTLGIIIESCLLFVRFSETLFDTVFDTLFGAQKVYKADAF